MNLPKGFLLMVLMITVEEVASAQSFSSSNLPIIVINTNGLVIPDEPKIKADMGIIDNGNGVRNNLTDAFNNFSGKIGIELRGSSSQSFPKKQYSIEVQDDLGNGLDASLLGMPAEEDWVLFAPYNDKSLMRDVLAYKLGRDLGRYASRNRFCELVLNGQYMGIYVLMEKVKRDANRVNIARLSPTEIAGDDLTGGYIIKIDKETGSGNGGWNSAFPPLGRSGSQQIHFQYDYPSATEIVTEQRNYIQQYIYNFEASLNSSTFNDPVNGYAKYIDVESFIDFFIINEVSKNVDGYRLSTYLYKEKDSDGGKLHMGPIWDFNLGFGNANYCTQGNPEGWVTGFNLICGRDYWLIPFWWSKLYTDVVYRNKLAARWSELRNGPLQTDNVLAYIDSVTNVLNAESQQRNFQRWPVLNTYVWPNYYVGPTFASEVNWLKNWVIARFQWLDSNMPRLITATENTDSDFSVGVYPNPFKSEILINYSIPGAGTMTFEMFDMLGRPIQSVRESHDHRGSFQTSLAAQNFPSGIYYFKANLENNQSISGRLIKCD